MTDNRSREVQFTEFIRNHEQVRIDLKRELREMSDEARSEYVEKRLDEFSKSGASAIFELIIEDLRYQKQQESMDASEAFTVTKLLGAQGALLELRRLLLEQPMEAIERRISEKEDEPWEMEGEGYA